MHYNDDDKAVLHWNEMEIIIKNDRQKARRSQTKRAMGFVGKPRPRDIIYAKPKQKGAEQSQGQTTITKSAKVSARNTIQHDSAAGILQKSPSSSTVKIDHTPDMTDDRGHPSTLLHEVQPEEAYQTSRRRAS